MLFHEIEINHLVTYDKLREKNIFNTEKKTFFLAKVTSVIFFSPRLILFLYFVVDNPDVISCDFESGFCGWSQSKADDADFSMNTGLLRTPTADHTPGKGLFIYIT